MKQLFVIYNASTDASIVDLLRNYGSDRNVELQMLRTDCSEVPVFSQKDILALVADISDGTLSPDLLEAIMLHVLEGGDLLFLAEGTKTRGVHELNLMMGARLLREMPYSEISVTAENDPLTVGFEAAELWDSAWIFERSVFDDAQVLISMTLGQQQYPLVWKRSWYLGQVYCMATGLPASARSNYSPVLHNILDAMGREE